jgi:hypothetical protein
VIDVDLLSVVRRWHGRDRLSISFANGFASSITAIAPRKPTFSGFAALFFFTASKGS